MDKCVLIVDDNDFNRELVKDILEDEDITVMRQKMAVRQLNCLKVNRRTT